MTPNLHKIVAIGGGEIGRPKEDGSGHYPVETISIDKEILRLANNKTATLLFIPTASNDSQSYYDMAKKHFLKIGFASVNVLYLLDKSPLTKTQIKETILSHDAVYVGGGDTLRMMTVWRRMGVDEILKTALDKGIVLSGLSAGSICWFNQGNSYSTGGSNKLIKVTGLGFIDAIHYPHYDVEPYRQSDIKKKMVNSTKVAICLDNCVAIEVVGNKYRIIKSKSTAKAHRVYWKNSRYYVEELEESDLFRDIDSLLTK
ncbi:MAG: peptidase E [Patescibacteria group bacterium]|jgi:dipeptidase E|nr:peptidase E [Patescibacteria group bacterium]